jgi:ArsR family transcriptional regulator
MDVKSVLRAFACHPRLKLILCLKKGRKRVTELISVCGLSQSAVSQHLDKLKNAGLVGYKKEGREVFYYLKEKKAAEISKELLKFVDKI